MQTARIMATRRRRIFRAAVWIGRAIGWTLLLVAILGAAQAELLPAIMGPFRLLPSVAVGLLAIVWILGFELFLRFFDRYLSGN